MNPNTRNYYINSNEIPSELSRENMIDNMLSSHMKRLLLLWLRMKIGPFDAFRVMTKYFIGVYIINFTRSLR